MSGLLTRTKMVVKRYVWRLGIVVTLLLFPALTAALGDDLPRRVPARGVPSYPPPADETEGADKAEERVREGTKIETTGYFRSTGDRVTFYSEGGKVRYRGLENLMLERIGKVIEDNPGQLEWSVTGVVTEYRGANFILVTHATQKANGGR